MTNKHGARGFTLIELVVVIVIIATLAAAALPRFTSLSTQARVAVVERVAGGMQSLSGIIHLEAIVERIDDGVIVRNGNNIDIRSSYIRGNWNAAWRYALDVGQVIGFTPVNAVCTKNDICGVGNQRSIPGLPFSTGGVPGVVIIWLRGDVIADRCYAYYFNPQNGDSPSIGTVTSGC